MNAVDVGQVIDGKYKLLRLLGDGGMGSVYEAQHLALGTHIAIKVLHPELTRKAGLIERFLQEARVSAQIRSPHVVQVTDFAQSQANGTAYLVMELLQGEPLSSVVKRERRLSVATATAYTVQILQALEAAHALDVIHRDLKPDNVFVTFEGGKPVVKLIDFGIAKLKRASAPGTKNLTVAGTLMGTPEYMAPEQAYSADKVDVRADLYSVGVMLYEMLSGQTPATGEDPRVVILKIERGEVTPIVQLVPDLKPELAGFVHRAMAPKPELRFGTASEMRLALEAILAGKRIPTSQLANANVTAKLGSDAPPPVKLADKPKTEANPATTARVAPIGTGTVMGAPAVAALDPMAQPPGTGTVRAAPIGQGPPNASTMAGGPSPMMMGGGHGMATPAYEPTRPPERRQSGGGGKGVIIALAVIALLLGAGAVVAYMAGTGAFDTSTPTAQPTFTPTTPVVTTPATTTAQIPTTPTQVTPVTPLTPGPVTPVTPTQPTQPTARVDAGAQPPRTDAGTAPSGQPHPFPPFPSGFPSALPPFPSGFPSAFPLPSGFPPIFPPQPNQ